MLPGAATVTTMGTEWVSESDNPTAVAGELFRLSTGAVPGPVRNRSCFVLLFRAVLCCCENGWGCALKLPLILS
ncbi:uncharacterized protein DS421_1g17600 [Arachis hypogaea]|nr:uncharacterized protein DS421_1g17600 [Arachis hypogaea]